MELPNQLTSVNSFCCFDLRTGGLILGYLKFVFNVYAFFDSKAFSYDFFFALLSLIVVVPWLCGIYENKYTYMRPNLIHSVIGTAIFFTKFVAATIATVFGLGLIDLIHISINLADIRNSMVHDACFLEFKRDILNIRKSVVGMILLSWFIYAICTAISCYFTIVMISLYKKMKAKSLGQQPGETTMPWEKNSPFAFEFGDSGLSETGMSSQLLANMVRNHHASETSSVDHQVPQTDHQVPQTDSLESIQITK